MDLVVIAGGSYPHRDARGSSATFVSLCPPFHHRPPRGRHRNLQECHSEIRLRAPRRRGQLHPRSIPTEPMSQRFGPWVSGPILRSETCWPNPSDLSSKSHRCRSKSCQFRPSQGLIRPNRGPDSAELEPNVAEFGPASTDKLGRDGPALAKFPPIFARNRPTFSKIGRHFANICRTALIACVRPRVSDRRALALR